MSKTQYKVTALGTGIMPDLSEIFRHRYFALKAVRVALKVYDSVKVERL